MWALKPALKLSQGGEIEWASVEPQASSEVQTPAGFPWAGSEPWALFSLG